MSVNARFNISVEILHRDFDIILYRNLLSAEECQHLIELGEPKLQRSGTMSNANDDRRTSHTAFFSTEYDDPVIRNVITRCSALCGKPRSHVETPQLVRYYSGQKFMNHLDNYAQTSQSYQKSGQRVYTFFVYLNSAPSDQTETGGETQFTNLDGKGQTMNVKPEQGMAVFWRNTLSPSGADDIRAYHQGLPPNDWTKYGLNVWIRTKPYLDIPVPVI